jgi:hypothetical protein
MTGFHANPIASMTGLLCKFRLSTLITLAVVAAVALTVALQLGVVNHFAVRQAGAEAELRLQQLSWQMRDSLNRVVEQATGDARVLAALPQVRQARNAAVQLPRLRLDRPGRHRRQGNRLDQRPAGRRQRQRPPLVPERPARRARHRLPPGQVAR